MDRLKRAISLLPWAGTTTEDHDSKKTNNSNFGQIQTVATAKSNNNNRNLEDQISHEKLFRLLGKRAQTIKTCFEILKGREENSSILELGTSRSFSNGSINTEHFNPDIEAWDWGAGCFTAVIKLLLPDCSLTSVDPNEKAVKVSKRLLKNIGHEASYVQKNSTDFLNVTNESYDLIYMDHAESGDSDACALLHRNDVAIILSRKLLKPNGLILIDDIQTPFNKGMYSVPLLKECGFNQLSKSSYQALLRKG
ncbi:class I SAM-dependent methyltransferase [Synechococcus sp. KORDI-52]|uniref:class I SAM-dependent methyltransferase n=1 Tax=Synechococcus sp. KORDI-52 TaxID=585425 RepID=UPI0008FFDD4D|nr:class I SAM-dependent methyltransferase [Synechococcus sp. KORDI-52]